MAHSLIKIDYLSCGSVVPNPSSMQVVLQDIDASTTGRNQKGTMQRDRVVGGSSAKRKISCTWQYLTQSQMSELLQAMGGVSFNVTYPDPYTGSNRNAKCYAGDRNTGVYHYYKYRGTEQLIWENVSVSFVEM